ncbi:hypothetical protein MOTT12_04598 [Mycobacterium intracellulare subsp. yongonense]|nr:hypothetical protein MOTT12_04598 [Mycobacterium intracellulare subsp. yongonense]
MKKSDPRNDGRGASAASAHRPEVPIVARPQRHSIFDASKCPCGPLPWGFAGDAPN